MAPKPNPEGTALIADLTRPYKPEPTGDAVMHPTPNAPSAEEQAAVALVNERFSKGPRIPVSEPSVLEPPIEMPLHLKSRYEKIKAELAALQAKPQPAAKE